MIHPSKWFPCQKLYIRKCDWEESKAGYEDRMLMNKLRNCVFFTVLLNGFGLCVFVCVCVWVCTCVIACVCVCFRAHMHSRECVFMCVWAGSAPSGVVVEDYETLSGCDSPSSWGCQVQPAARCTASVCSCLLCVAGQQSNSTNICSLLLKKQK